MRSCALSEVTHPYWHLTERGVEVDFASPSGRKVVWDHYSAKLETTLKLKGVALDLYDAVHVAGGRGATFDLYPNAAASDARADTGPPPHHAWRNCLLASNRVDAPARLRNWPDGILVEVGVDAL
jgi:hypothetical protein